MFITSWFPWSLARQHKSRARPPNSQTLRRCGTRLTLEQLEDRTVPSNFTAATVSDLIADINLANKFGGSNTITLVAGNTFTVTAVNNTTNGPNGLPAITANDNLTIKGNGDTIVRSATATAFRLFDVASGATLTLENATLKGGLANPGGAIYNEGALTLRSVTVTGNSAVGSGYGRASYTDFDIGGFGMGGGIYSGHGASLALEAGTVITNNSAVGSTVPNHSDPYRAAVYVGGNGLGGGVYVDGGGTATLSGVTLSNNTARGGDAGDWGGAGEGGALFAQGYAYSAFPATVTLSNCLLISNAAVGGKGKGSSNSGGAIGGAVCVSDGATATLTSDTFSSNSAVGGSASGGAVYVDTYSTATLRQCTISGNSAQISRGSSGIAEGGGVFIHSGAKVVYLDAFTLANTVNDTDSSGTNGNTANIDGSYTLI
jgi:hypothetical protein